MKKIINRPEDYTDEMLYGIYRAYGDKVHFANDDLRCYCTNDKIPGKVAIITGGGTGHLPLFLGYVGKGLLDGCAVGSVFQSPSAEQIYAVSKEVEAGAGILYLYGNYTGDIMNFDMASELCEVDNIKTLSFVGADDVNSGEPEVRRGVAGIYFLYKAAGACAAKMGTLEQVYAAAEKASKATRTVGFALTPCIIPEVGKPNFTLGENEMAMGMGIHGEPGIWNGPVKTADDIAAESLECITADMPLKAGDEVCVLINGLGATSLDEQYILYNSVYKWLNERGIRIYRPRIGEFATSMEMMGASVTICKLDEELKEYLDFPVDTPFIR